MTKTLARGYSSDSTQRELSNEYQHDRVLSIFKKLSVIVFWTKVASALEGFNTSYLCRHFALTVVQLLGKKRVKSYKEKTTPKKYKKVKKIHVI